MTYLALIDNDYESLKQYFEKLFELLKESIEDETKYPTEVYDSNTEISPFSHHGISHHIKPDMIINIYSFLDFWLKKICEYHKNKNNLKLTYRDIKGKNDLNAYHKYLERYVGLNLQVTKEYSHLDKLREIRNKFIHQGGYIQEHEVKKFSIIDGIEIYAELITIDKKYIFESLKYAKSYIEKTLVVK